MSEQDDRTKKQDEQAKNDQTKFWIDVVEGLSNNISGLSNPEKSLILVNGNIPCLFDSDNIEIVQQQIHQIGNVVVPFTLTWDGVTGGDLFRQYQAFVDDLFPDVALSDDKKKEIKDKMDSVNLQIGKTVSGITSLLKDQLKDYMSNYCLQVDESGYKCLENLPGAPTVEEYMKEYKDGAEYKEKVSILAEENSDSLLGLQQTFDKLAVEYYGENYHQLQIAKDAVKKADFDDLVDGDTSFQMKTTNQNGASSYEPLYSMGNLDEYKKWLHITKTAFDNGDDPSVQIVFDNKIDTRDETKWQFTSQATIPVSYFFQVNVSASSQSDKIEMSKYEFNASLTYQDVVQFSLSPSDKWFFSNLLTLYKDFPENHPDSVFHGKKLWGADGLLASNVRGVIIGYGESLKIECDKWSQSDYTSSWKTSTSFGIGPIHFASGSASGSSSHHEVKQNDQGMEIKDVTGLAKILAVIVDTPNN